MESDLERRLSNVPRTDEERAALRGLLRMRSEGKSLDEIAAGLKAEVGLELSPAAVDPGDHLDPAEVVGLRTSRRTRSTHRCRPVRSAEGLHPRRCQLSRKVGLRHRLP